MKLIYRKEIRMYLTLSLTGENACLAIMLSWPKNAAFFALILSDQIIKTSF